VATVVVAAWEKELDRTKLRSVIRGETPVTESAGA
jgi:aerobic C4-dicarboxylate transport protein